MRRLREKTGGSSMPCSRSRRIERVMKSLAWFLLAWLAATPAIAHDYMAVTNRPNQLHLIDLVDQKIVRSCTLPGRYGSGTMQISHDKRTAFVLSNQFENIYGVDLETCKITFSAIQSEGD